MVVGPVREGRNCLKNGREMAVTSIPEAKASHVEVARYSCSATARVVRYQGLPL